MALLHGINDFVSASIFHIPMAIFFIIVFMAYLVHDEVSAKQEVL